jgi:recombinational DNA repair protein (RecF pathway)
MVYSATVSLPPQLTTIACAAYAAQQLNDSKHVIEFAELHGMHMLGSAATAIACTVCGTPGSVFQAPENALQVAWHAHAGLQGLYCISSCHTVLLAVKVLH